MLGRAFRQGLGAGFVPKGWRPAVESGPPPGPITFDITAFSYASKSKSVLAEYSTNVANGLYLSPDDTKIFVFGHPGSKINVGRYDFGVVGDITTAAYSSKFKDLTAQETSIRAGMFGKAGTRMYFVGDTSDTIFQHNVSTAYDPLTASDSGKSLNLSGIETAPHAIDMSDDGARLFVVGTSGDTIRQFTLSVAWELDSATEDSAVAFSVATWAATPRGLKLTHGGRVILITDTTTDTIFQFNMPTANSLAGIEYSGLSLSVTTQDNTPSEVTVSSDETRLYVLGTTNSTIYQYNKA